MAVLTGGVCWIAAAENDDTRFASNKTRCRSYQNLVTGATALVGTSSSAHSTPSQLTTLPSKKLCGFEEGALELLVEELCFVEQVRK